jgi:3-oxoadipate enol-lactonase/4-carboxymuconolactone decarboxylase
LPFLTVHDIRLFYRLEGKAGAPVIVLSHSIGADHGMWAQQAADLLPYFQVLRCDIRGHGASDAPPGDYSIELLGRDVLALTLALAIPKFAFCGLSLGGTIGQWLAINAPDRVTALVLANTSPRIGTQTTWETRMRLVREGGMAAILEVAMQRYFLPETLADGEAFVDSMKSVFLATNPAGYLGCCAALRDADFRAALPQIHAPTLVIGGESDIAAPWESDGEILAREIPGARAVLLPAAHLSNLERPRSFSAALLDFLLPPARSGDGSLQAGVAVRRAVLGNDYVDRAIAGTNDFNREFQELITRYAWGTIWTRPVLDHRTRRLLLLATTAALGRWEEFTLHVRAGLAHGMEPCDLKEVLLQIAIYAGAPAANTAFHIAGEEIEKAKSR